MQTRVLDEITEVTPFARGLAEAAAADPAVAGFYRGNGFEAIWTDPEADDRARLAALAAAFGEADLHALPLERFSEEALRERLAEIGTEADRARAEADLSALYLGYAHAVQSGILESDTVAPQIKRKPPRRDGGALLARLTAEPPEQVMRSLPPASPEYANLLRARVELGRVVAAGGWGATRARGQVPAGRQRRGRGGAAQPADRHGLSRAAPRATASTTGWMRRCRRFQEDHGLAPDGVAGGNTLAEMNLSAEERLGQVVVAMERERW